MVRWESRWLMDDMIGGVVFVCDYAFSGDSRSTD